jgi:hypothetical protein
VASFISRWRAMSPFGTFRTCRDGCLESVMRSKADIAKVLLTYSCYAGRGLIALQFGTSPKPVRPYPISAEQIPSPRCSFNQLPIA